MALKYKRKLMENFGLTPDRIVDKLFQIKTSGGRRGQPVEDDSKRGMLKWSEFDRYWGQIQFAPKACAEFLVELLSNLEPILLQKKTLPPNLPLSSIVNTIQFVALFYENDVSDPRRLGTLCKKITQACSKLQTVDSRGIMQAVQTIELMEDKDEGIDKMLRWFINWCDTTQYTARDNGRPSEAISSATLDPAEPSLGVHTFLFTYLLELVESKKTKYEKEKLVQAILGETVKRVSAIPQLIKMNPKIAESTLLSYVQMLQELMKMGSAMKVEQLCQAIRRMQQFFFWPRPLGDIVKDVMLSMERECLLPGHSMHETLKFESTCARSRTTAGPLQQQQSLVYHIFDGASSATATMRHVLSVPLHDEKESGSRGSRLRCGEMSLRMKALILLNLLVSEITLERSEIQQFLKLSEKVVEQLYDESQAVLNHIQNQSRSDITPEQSEEYRASKFTEIRNKWASMAGVSDGSKPIGDELKGLDMNRLHDQGFPLFRPPIRHVGLEAKLDYTFVTPEQRKLTCELEVLPPEPDFYETFKDIIRTKLLYGASSERKVTVRVAMSGGDRLTHQILCSMIRMYKTVPTITESVNFLFYPVPLVENSLACYLARNDSWYRRHVYAPFSTPKFLVPWVKVEPLEDAKTNTDATVMGKVFNGLLNSYVREAKQQLPIRVWSCNVYDHKPAWDHKVDAKDSRRRRQTSSIDGEPVPVITETPAQILPFFQRVEIGHRAELARYIQREEEKAKKLLQSLGRSPSAQDGKELMKLRNEHKPENDEARYKKYEDAFARQKGTSTPEIKIRFARVNAEGKYIGVEPDMQFIGYQNIIISNLPRFVDSNCFPARPEDPWLEMSAQTSSSHSSKKFILNSEPMQHVSRVEISVRGDDRFSILVDGQLFPQSTSDSKATGYQSLVIEKFIGKNGQQMTFPVQTFFPVRR